MGYPRVRVKTEDDGVRNVCARKSEVNNERGEEKKKVAGTLFNSKKKGRKASRYLRLVFCEVYETEKKERNQMERKALGCAFRLHLLTQNLFFCATAWLYLAAAICGDKNKMSHSHTNIVA